MQDMLVKKLLNTCMTLTWLIIRATVWGVNVNELPKYFDISRQQISQEISLFKNI